MRLFAIVAAGLAALALWRRKDVAAGAKRASQSAGELASSAQTKIGRSSDETIDATDTTGELVDASEEATTEAGDVAAASAADADPGRPSV